MPQTYAPDEWQPMPGGFAVHCPAIDAALVSGRLPLVLQQPPRPPLPGCSGTLRIESDPVAGQPMLLRESNWGYRRFDAPTGWDPSFASGRRDNSMGCLVVARLLDGSVLFLREKDGRPLPAGGGSIDPEDLAPGMTLDSLAEAAGLRELIEETDGTLPGTGEWRVRPLAVVRYPNRGGRPDIAVEIRTSVAPRDVPGYLRDRARPLTGSYRTEIVPPAKLRAFLKDWARRVPVCGALYGLVELGVLVP